MDLNKYKETLGDSNFAELQQYVSSLISQKDEARAESISGRKTLKSEVEALRKVKETLYDKLGLDDDADLETLQVPTKGAEIEAVKQYERKLKKLEQELIASKESYTGLETRHKGSLLDAQLTKAISGHDFLDADLVTELVRGRVKFEGDELIFAEGDKTLSLSEGVTLLAQTKPHLLKAQGAGGSGFNPNATSGKVKSFADMTLTEKNDLCKANPEQYRALKAAA